MIKNAKITSTMLGVEDHGIFSFSLMLDYGGSMQGYGGYALDEPIRDKDDKFVRRVGTAYGCEAIMQLLAVLDVSRWENLPGTYVRVEAGDGWNGTITRIGHPLKDKWLDLKALVAEVEAWAR